jgi:hypothetical protein
MNFGMLICRCKVETLLSEGDLERIKVHPLHSHRFEAYINFVCHDCGLCSQYSFDNILLRSLERPAVARLTLLHADLLCEGKDCQTGATVHTIPDNDMANPMRDVQGWQVGHIHCPSAHPPRQPAAVTAIRVTY